jgi:transcriptional regulator with XRE-family HTH domain
MRKVRDDSGKSKTRIARELGMKVHRYRQIETGTVFLRIDELETLMNYFKIEPQRILPPTLERRATAQAESTRTEERSHLVDVTAYPGEKVQVIINVLEPTKRR